MFITLKQLKEALTRLLSKVMEEINNLRKNSYTKEEVDELLAEGDFGGGSEEIYIGGGEFPEGYKLQIDTSGAATGIVEDVQYNGKSVVDKDTSVATIPSLIVVGEDSSEDWVMRINPDEEGVTSVEDVQINGVSIVNEGVANLPIANEPRKHGLIKLDYFVGAYPTGLNISSDGTIYIRTANNNGINLRSGYDCILDVRSLDYAVKAAMCDGKGAQWTPEEKSAARMRLGDEWRYIGKFETQEDVASMSIALDSEGNPFSLRKVRIVFKNMPNQSDLSSQIKIRINNNKWEQDWFSRGVKITETYRIADIELEKICNHLRVNTLYGSKNATTTCDTFTTLYDANAYFYSRSEFEDFINEIQLLGTSGNNIGAGAIVEVWGVDA